MLSSSSKNINEMRRGRSVTIDIRTTLTPGSELESARESDIAAAHCNQKVECMRPDTTAEFRLIDTFSE